jgi:DNA-binding response OmpR family regulator
MSQKRVLLLHEDPLLASLFRDKLEAAGLTVEAARSGDVGLKAAAERRPDAVALDPVLPGPEATALIKQLRAIGGAQPTPVIVLPTARPVLSELAKEAGADVVLLRGVNPVADLVDAVQTKLGLEKAPAHTKGLMFRPEESWLARSLDAAPGTLVALRHALREANREGGDPTAMPDFFHRIHGLAEQMAVLGQRSLHCLTAQIEALAFDLSKFPEQINPSVLRTLGQALDFLATLLPDAVRDRLKDPGAAQVLIVDDEDGARKIIMVAMRLANLKSMAADTPSAGLAALGVQGFDLIFLDVGLPEMNGFELGAKIRALPMHEKTPIIFITGMATFQNRVQSSLSGGNDFVGKPFSLPELGLKALIWVFKGQLGQV